MSHSHEPLRTDLAKIAEHRDAQPHRRLRAHHRLCALLHPRLSALERRQIADLDFFTKLPNTRRRDGGGMANAIVGSGKLLLLASLIGMPIGVMAGIYLAEFGGKTFSFIVRYTTDLLNGVPSIVIGIFAYALVVVPMHHFSTLAGGFALGVMMIPIAVRSTEEFLRAVPVSMREGAMALGASKWKTIATVVVPAAFQGIMTGLLLDLARVAGETAPLLFTALHQSLLEPRLE